LDTLNFTTVEAVFRALNRLGKPLNSGQFLGANNQKTLIGENAETSPRSREKYETFSGFRRLVQLKALFAVAGL